MPFRNRVRLPFYLSRPQFPAERNVFRKADGSTHVLSTVIRNTYEGKTDQLPKEWHQRLIIALSHRDVTIEDNRFLSGVVLDGDYTIDWQEFLDYPVAQANFSIQTTPFNASSDNCTSCEEISQLSLVDDFTDEIWGEGTTHEYPDIITANDNICCFPYTIELMSYNTLYFDSVTIDAAGVLTAIVKAQVPPINNVLIATYRVTCENGGYDEANVYGNLDGTGTDCIQPTGLDVELNDDNGSLADVTWDVITPAPAGGYDWALYECEDIYTVIQSGNTADEEVDLTSLTPGQCYIFVVVTNCGGGSLSAQSTIQFTTPVTGTATCGRFQITFFGTFATIDYVNCSGDLIHEELTGSQIIYRCMLMSAGTTTPVLFQSFGGGVTNVYDGPC